MLFLKLIAVISLFSFNIYANDSHDRLMITNKDYKTPMDLIADGYPGCIGGGVNYRFKNLKHTKLFKQFREANPYCLKHPADLHGYYYQEKRKLIHKKIQEILKEDQCYDVEPLIKSFQKINKHTMSYIKDIQPVRDYYLKKYLKDLKGDIQLLHAYTARGLQYCGAHDVSIKIWPYWNLYSRLKELNDLGPKGSKERNRVEKNNQVLNSCKNVVAHGADNLEKFSIDLKGKNLDFLNLDFDAYIVKDHIKVSLDGKEILNSNCISGAANLNLEASDLRSAKKLEVKVLAKCEDPTYSTYWKLNINCEEQVEPICDNSSLVELEHLLKNLLESSNPLLEHYWRNVICYEEVHTKLVSEYQAPPHFLESIQDCSDCDEKYSKEKPTDQNSKLEQLNYKKEEPKGYTLKKYNKENESEIAEEDKNIDDKKLSQSTEKEYKSRKPSSKLATQRLGNINERSLVQGQKLYFNKLEYLNNREDYCRTIRTGHLDLFKSINRRYCLSAFPKLIENNID